MFLLTVCKLWLCFGLNVLQFGSASFEMFCSLVMQILAVCCWFTGLEVLSVGLQVF